jgi:hypothetical protein
MGDFRCCATPDMIIKALKSSNLSQTPLKLTSLLVLLARQSVDGSFIWSKLNVASANLLAGHVASSINSPTPIDVPSIKNAYKMVIHILEGSVGLETHSKYTQWVARETPSQMSNLNVIFNYLRLKDAEIRSLSGVGKLR